jgi:hypothetical protein
VATGFGRWRFGAYGLPCVLALLVAAPAFGTSPASSGANPLCSHVLGGFMHCDAFVSRVDPRLARSAVDGPPYSPADLQSAYQLADKAASAGSDQTVAIVDAYDDPNAESDLAAYRSYYSLPACTTANGCFRKVNQAGGTTYPAPDVGWAGEIALDLDMVSAICPNCHILLVEANSNSASSLYAAVNRAATLGATQISNSWGGDEYRGEQSAEPNFDHPGIPITVSSGDGGYGVEYPAASAHVTAVGGTSLRPASNSRGWSESAWAFTGSGCSSQIAKPVWEDSALCPNRMVADVSAVADPATGVRVYNTYGAPGTWWQFGGTSVSAPIVAAAYALLGSSATATSFAYDDPAWFNDVTSGSNGSCSIVYFCTSVAGFDGPTGIGSPNLAHDGDGTPVVIDGSGGGATPPGGTASPAPSPPPVQPPPSVPVRTAVLSSVSVGSASTRPARNGRLRVLIRCGHTAVCSGVLTLQTRLRGTALRKLGSARYNLAPGKSAWVVVRLSSSDLRLLRERHSLRVYGTALDSDGTAAQSSLMLHAPKPTKQRKPTR